MAFFRWVLRRKRRGGGGCDSSRPRSLELLADRAGGRSGGPSKGPWSFRPELTNLQLRSLKAAKLEIGFLRDFSGPKTGKSPFSKRGRSLAHHSQ